MSLAVQQTVPILRIFDEAKAKEFYVGFLGMTVDWEYRFEPDTPLYMQVSGHGLVLHLSEHHGDACPGANVFLRVTGLVEYHRGLLAKQYRHLRPGLEETFYGTRCMETIDPFGNRLRFNEELESGG